MIVFPICHGNHWFMRVVVNPHLIKTAFEIQVRKCTNMLEKEKGIKVAGFT